MNRKILEQLMVLPRLDVTNRNVMQCKVCEGRASFFDVVDFNKFCSAADCYGFGHSDIPVTYLRCDSCGFVFTTFFDDWSVEDFARFVYNDDYVKVDGEYLGSRPMRDAAAVAKRLDGLAGLRILDYGSGSGLLGTNLRSHGFDNVTSYDPFSNPHRPDDGFDVITCFEVLEHTTAPRATLADIADLLDPQGCILFTTGIQPQNIDLLRANWWYIAPRNGHVSIYTLKTLARAGQEVGLTLHAGSGGTAFAGPNASPTSRQVLSSIGLGCQFLNLTAPQELTGEQATSWHGVEANGATSYRWTREAEVVWRLQCNVLQPCELTVNIPFRNEIRPGFADDCRVVVGNKSIVASREGTNLKASLTLNEPVAPTIKLVTPPLLRPCDFGTVPDKRWLGLAIATG